MIDRQCLVYFGSFIAKLLAQTVAEMNGHALTQTLQMNSIIGQD